MTEPTIADSGERREFATGAVRDMSAGKGRFDLLCPFAISELAKHMERGCVKYGERNWEKGIPQSSFIDSATRHLNKHAAGEFDEDHLLAAFWNLHCAVSQRERANRGLLNQSIIDFPPKRESVKPRTRVEQITFDRERAMARCDEVCGEEAPDGCTAHVYCGSRKCLAILGLE